MKKTISFVLALVLVLALVPFSFAPKAEAASLVNRNFVTLKKEKSTIAPGVEQEIGTVRKKYNGQQLVYYLMTIDTDSGNEYVPQIHVNYMNNDWESYQAGHYGLQTVENQMNAAQAKHSNPEDTDNYIENFTIVGGINGTGYNMSTGESSGYILMMEGHELGTANQGFFGVRKSGKAFIGWSQAEYEQAKKDEDPIVEALGQFSGVLIKNGVIQENCDWETDPSKAPNCNARTAVGVTEEGDAVFLVVDGKQAPYSEGCDMYELAEILFKAGCYNAFNWDGGGSTTYVSRPEGEKTYRVVSKPCDGAPRNVATSLYVATTAPDTKEFDHAAIDTNVEYITPEGTINLTAVGITAAGTPVDIPAGATWYVDPQFGTIDGSITDAVFTSSGTTGTFDISIKFEDEIVGKTTVNVVIPTTFSFKRPTYGAPYGETFDLDFNIKYETKDDNGEVVAEYDVTPHPGDISLTVDPAECAKINDITLTLPQENEITSDKKEAILTAKLVCSMLPEDTAQLKLGLGSTVLYDFEGENYKNVDTFFSVDPKSTGYIMDAEIVDGKNGMVHGGDHSLKVTLDMSPNVTTAIGGGVWQVWVVANEATDISGATGVGFWIWIPDEDKWTSIMVPVDQGDKTPYVDAHNREGIKYDEGHWCYAYIDLSAYAGLPLSARPKFVSIMLYGQASDAEPLMSVNNKLTFYIDDYTIDYGTVTDDRTMPVIGDITPAGSFNVLTRESIFDFGEKNTVAFTAPISDPNEGRKNGINESSSKAYIDGVDIGSKVENGKIVTDSVTLAPGEHTLKLYISDNSGNTTNATRRFTISSGNAATVKLVASDRNTFKDKVPMDSIFWMDLKATDISKIQEVSVDLDLNNISEWELAHAEVNPNFTLEWSKDGFYAVDENIATVTITRKADDECIEYESDILASLPVRAWGKDIAHDIATKAWTDKKFFPVDISVEVDRGEIKYLTGYDPGVTPVFAGGVQVDTECYDFSPVVVEATENAGKEHWHFHDEATSVENTEPTCTDFGYKGRTICKTCGSPIDWGTVTPPTGHNYVEKEGERVCETCGQKFTGVFNGKTYIDGVTVKGWQEDGSYYDDGVKFGPGLHQTMDTISDPSGEGEDKIVTRWHLFGEDSTCDEDNREDAYTGYYIKGKGGSLTAVEDLPEKSEELESSEYYYIEGGLPYTGWLFFRKDGSMIKPSETPEGDAESSEDANPTETPEGTEPGMPDKEQQQAIIDIVGYHVHSDGRVHSVSTEDTRKCVVSGYIEYSCNGCTEKEKSEKLWWIGHDWDENHKCRKCNLQGMDIGDATLNIMGENFEYTGGEIRAAVLVYYKGLSLSIRSDKNGLNGYVSYENNTDIGVATVHIRGEGDFYGNLSGTFNIVPKSVKTVSKTETKGSDKDVTIQLSWDAALGADYYTVIRYDYDAKEWKEVGPEVEGTSFSETLPLNTRYYYQVASRAVRDDTIFYAANWSSPVSGTVKHVWGEELNKVEATCQKEGSYHHICAQCGFEEDVVVPKLEHQVEEWEVTKEPTTSEEGERQGVCTVCHEEVTESIEKLPPVSTGTGGSTAPSNKQETVTNPDGSTTTTTTKPDGSKTETTTQTDGTVTEKNTAKSGVVTETTKKTDGTVTEKVTQTDGSATERTTTPEGVTGQVDTDNKGEVKAAEVVIPKEAEKQGTVTAPVEVPAVKDAEKAPEISVKTESSESTRVEIPVTEFGPGTVAVLVHPDGTEEVVRDCVTGENGVVLNVEGDVTLKIVDNTQTFADVEPTNHWATGAVEFVAARNLFNGTGVNEFSPDGEMTRGMLVTVLHRLAYEPEQGTVDFADVDNSAYYANAVAWAASTGVVKGVEDNSFAPEDEVTREQLVTILYRYVGMKGYDTTATGSLSRFTDAGSVSDYAREAMDWAVGAGLITGDTTTTVSPTGDASRAQVATILMRFCESVVK